MAEIKGDLAQILCGIPIMIPGCNIAVSQPKVKDICAFGEDSFFLALNMFLKADKMAEEIKQGNSQLSYLSDFQILMVVFEQEPEAKSSIIDLFNLIFPNYIYEFDAGCINFRIEESERIIGRLDPMNFENFQGILKTLFFPQGGVNEDEDPEYKPANDKAAEIAAKLKRGNEIRRQMKEQENGKNAPSSLFATYASTLAIGLGIDINILFGYTPFQLFDAFIRYNKKSAYDLYQKVSTTPMMDVSKMDAPDIWFGDIYNQ
nr:MAG TPA: hypothetical protein [Caudoviricetes sp.]